LRHWQSIQQSITRLLDYPIREVRALVAGFQNHVPTPVDANQLAAAMAKLIAR
jgi:hypothetical protein